MKIPTVALVGRPNTGKSTLFNRIAGARISIIEDSPGITRDRIYSKVTHRDYVFNLIDTGGIDISKEVFNDEIKVQAEIAIEEADVVVFVVDGKYGLTTNDYAIRDMLRKTDKKVLVAINKMDTKQSDDNIYDFYELGFEHYFPMSAEQKDGIWDMLEEATADFELNPEEIDDDIIRFSIIGRPNVGKSSLVNALLQEEKAIVSDIAGTTRDAVDSPFKYHDRDFIVIDTAGMRKKGKIYETVEKYSLIRSLKAIDRSDVCVIVIDAATGIVEHDKHIAGYALDAGKALVIVVNKWDTVDNKDGAIREFTKDVRNNFAFLSFVPIVFLSALTKKRIHTLMPEIIKVYDNSHKQIKTSLLNNVITDAVSLNPPPSYKGKRLKVFFAHQSGSKPPKFTINVNNKGLVHFSYERYLKNKLRENFDLEGTPILIKFKNKDE